MSAPFLTYSFDWSVCLKALPFLERGRTIVPLSFINGALSFKVEYDAKTNHVLITKNK